MTDTLSGVTVKGCLSYWEGQAQGASLGAGEVYWLAGVFLQQVGGPSQRFLA